MSFDPERIDVWELNYDSSNKCAEITSMTTDRGSFDGDRFVLREDYDQLLELYREAIGQRAAHEAELNTFFERHGIPNATNKTGH